jgi:hypothetical protein
MAPRHVIVDGSNLATEGRSMPSLAQLDLAVREFIAENPADVVTVVVDASFGHRIDPSEVSAFEEAEEAGEVVSPPAGAIGRGDAFLLRIAEKTGATVLSNDSFQEFHGEHTWLFDKGRLVGGKPVPGVGWIFMDRTPVRGAKSREVTKEAKRKKRAETDTPVASGKVPALAEAKPRSRSKVVDRAIARATEEVVEPKADGKSRRRRGSSSPPAEPVNEPLAFITFIAAHPLGSEVIGTVLEYSSHGAFVEADGARCYVPLSAMGNPPPRRAREVVSRGEAQPFVVQAFDPQRRGIELALPGFARVAGGPTAETVEAEISAGPEPVETASPPSRSRRRAPVAADDPGAPAKKAAGRPRKAAAPTVPEPVPVPALAKKAAPAKKAASAKKAARKAPASAPAPVPEAAPAVAKKATSRARKAAVPAPATAKRAGAARKAAPSSPVKPAAPAKKVAPVKKAAPAPAKKVATPAKKASSGAKKAAAPAKRAGRRTTT